MILYDNPPYMYMYIYGIYLYYQYIRQCKPYNNQPTGFLLAALMPVFWATGLTSWKAASESCSVSSVISMRVPPRVWTSLSCCCALAWQWKIPEKWRLQRGIFHWQQGKLSNSVTLFFQHMSQVSDCTRIFPTPAASRHEGSCWCEHSIAQ